MLDTKLITTVNHACSLAVQNVYEKLVYSMTKLKFDN